MLSTAGRDRIGVLRAVGSAMDALALRRALERAIAPVSLRPRGLGAGAILCVRRVRMSGDVATQSWATQLESQVQDAGAHAARPFDEMVPANANAVVFRDEREMLACLLRDRSRSAWWWRGLLGANADAAMVVQRLLEAPMLLPSIVALLAERGEAIAVLESLPRGASIALSDAITRAFGLPRAESLPSSSGALAAALDTGAERRPHIEERRAMRMLREVLQRAGDADAIIAMRDEPRHLLVLCLLVARAPALARARPAAPLAERWIRWNRSARRAEAVVVPVVKNATHEAHRVEERANSGLRYARRGVAATLAITQDVSPAMPIAQVLPTLPSSEKLAPIGGALRAAVSPTAVDEINATAQSVQQTNETSITTEPLAHQVASDFAGVFYLVNVFLHLELYADFANPERTSVPLALGDLLALLGLRYGGEEFRRDPVWRVLATIAGRDIRQPPRRSLRAGVVRRRDVRAFNRWFGKLLARIEDRLSRALAMPAGETLAYLCARRGTLALTDTRLDVRFPLDEHPLAIRLAGVDRDPGWVPAMGRSLAFHYD